jgi:hypothetical protein
MYVQYVKASLKTEKKWHPKVNIRPGKKWDLVILRYICLSNKIEEHFEFFTHTLSMDCKITG